jgi:hypothetical protein
MYCRLDGVDQQTSESLCTRNWILGRPSLERRHRSFPLSYASGVQGGFAGKEVAVRARGGAIAMNSAACYMQLFHLQLTFGFT